MDRHMFVRHEMYRDQTDEPRSANFAKNMHVDKVRLPMFKSSYICIKIGVFLLCIRVFQREKLNKLQRVSLMRQKRDCDVITLKIIVHLGLVRPIKVAIMCV